MATSSCSPARGNLERAFIVKVTSPKNLLKAFLVVAFGFLAPFFSGSGGSPPHTPVRAAPVRVAECPYTEDQLYYLLYQSYFPFTRN